MKPTHPHNGRDATSHPAKSHVHKKPAEKLTALKEKEAPLMESQEQNQTAPDQLSGLKKISGQADFADQELQPSLMSLEETATALTQSQKKTEELQLLNQALQKENDALKGRVHAAEEKASQQVEIINREQREGERQRLQFEGKIHGLEDRIQELQKKVMALQEKLAAAEGTEETSPQKNVPGSKAAFRLDLYACDEGYQGTILHFVSGDKRTLKGFEADEIVQFIRCHLPPLEQKAAPIEPKNVSPPQSLHTTHLRPEVETGTPALAINAVQPATRKPGHFVLCHDKPLQLQAKLDLSKLPPTDLPMDYKLIVSARRLGHTNAEILGERNNKIEAPGAFFVNIQTDALHLGTYRLHADLTCERAGKKYKSSVEGGIVKVC